MSTGNSGVRAFVVSLFLIPGLLLAVLLGVIFTSDATSQACNPTGAALIVDPASVPDGPIAGYNREQLVNAAHVMLSAQRLGLTLRDQQIGVMTAMGESSLHVLDYGDAVGPDSRGLFQQRDNGAWGSYSDRMDPFISATSFFKVEMTIAGRESMEPTLVAHAVQRNADPYHYERYWTSAVTVVEALGGIREQTSAAPQSESNYPLGPVRPQTAAVANTLGPMFGFKTIGGYRAGNTRDVQGHPAGLALDFMTNDFSGGRDAGNRLSAYLQEHAAALGVKYIIWEQRIWSVERADEGWRPMADRGSPTQNHMDHVHLSLTGDGSSAIPAEGAGCAPAPATGEVGLSGWALPAQGPLTSGFGPRVPPTGKGSSFHSGIDLAPGCDKPIYAANAGIVSISHPGWAGNLIAVDHGNGIMTRYAHMYNDGVMVRIGDRVTAGQQIGRIGSNGNSTGCHLHFEVLQNGTQVDPKPFLDQLGLTITS